MKITPIRFSWSKNMLNNLKNRKKEWFLGMLLTTTCLVAKSSDIYANTYASGTGTQTDPYLISTPDHLEQLRQDVASGLVDGNSYFKLANDIDLSSYDNDADSSNGNWTPIGTSTNPFIGHFDGNGFAVENMTINLPQTSYVGLFGYAKEDSTISNVGVEKVDISGQSNIGALVGTFQGNSITQSYSTGTVNGGGDYVGGLVGSLGDWGVVSNGTHLYSTTNVKGKDFVGGIVGFHMEGEIQRSYTIGEVVGSWAVGGITGNQVGTLIDVYSASTIKGNDDVGGLAGVNEGPIVKSYFVGSVEGSPNSSGPLFGGTISISQGAYDSFYNTDTYPENVKYEFMGTPLSTNQMIGETVKTTFKNFDFDNVWEVTDGYPILRGIYNVPIQPPVINQAPTLTVSDIVIHEGEEFKPSDYITYQDDLDAIDDLVVDVIESVDTNTPGKYPVTYTVTDTEGLFVTQTVEVTVNAKPKLTVSDIHIPVNSIFEPSLYVTASDHEDLSEQLIINFDSPDLKLNVSGRYEATYTVTDTHGAQTSQTVEVHVVDLPTITTTEMKFTLGSTHDLLNYATAADEEGTPLTVTVKETNLDTTNPGTYQVTFQAVDQYGIEAFETVEVEVLPEFKTEDMVVLEGIALDLETYIQSQTNWSPDWQLRILTLLDDLQSVGEHVVEYQITTSNGTIIDESFIIKVLPSINSDDSITDQPTSPILPETPDKEENDDSISGTPDQGENDGSISGKPNNPSLPETPEESDKEENNEIYIPETNKPSTDKENGTTSENKPSTDKENIETGLSNNLFVVAGLGSLFLGLWFLKRKNK